MNHLIVNTLYCIRPGETLIIEGRKHLVIRAINEYEFLIREKPAPIDYVRFAKPWLERWMRGWDQRFLLRYSDRWD